jgi:hypothetical protein
MTDRLVPAENHLKMFSVVFCADLNAHPREIITDNFSSKRKKVE